VTCVVDRIVVTHFRNPVVGVASATRGWTGLIFCTSSMRWRVFEDSNQNKQVIYSS
jgi:hypothetical protein